MKIANIPNALTVGRIVGIFIFLILANITEPDVWPYLSASNAQAVKIVAFILAFIAGLTDFFDGYLARKYNSVTDFGKLVDPLADKIFVAAIMLMMVEFQMMPAWIAVIIISREFLVTGLRMLAIQKNIVISADGWGKVKTTMQMVMLFIACTSWINLFSLHHDILVFGGSSWVSIAAGDSTKTIQSIGGELHVRIWFVWKLFLWIVTGVTVYSGIGYFTKFKSIFKD